MPVWNGEITCPKCKTWQIPGNYCPTCGHDWQDARKKDIESIESYKQIGEKK